MDVENAATHKHKLHRPKHADVHVVSHLDDCSQQNMGLIPDQCCSSQWSHNHSFGSLNSWLSVTSGEGKPTQDGGGGEGDMYTPQIQNEWIWPGVRSILLHSLRSLGLALIPP